LAFALAAALIACHDATGPAPLHPTATLLSGTWDEQGEVSGSADEWILSVSDTVIAGTGFWSAEACCGGTLQIVGHLHADSIFLAVKTIGNPFQPADEATPFVGTLIAGDEMLVSLVTTDPTARPFRMRKKQTVPSLSSLGRTGQQMIR
jgi:hypothetical protein